MTIVLGAFGHGGGAHAARTAFAATACDPHIVGVIWIVWYLVSGCMPLFEAVSLSAWFAACPGASRSGCSSLCRA